VDAAAWNIKKKTSQSQPSFVKMRPLKDARDFFKVVCFWNILNDFYNYLVFLEILKQRD